LSLGTLATIADAEEVEVMAWEDADCVTLDSQGVIQRIWNLQYDALVMDRRDPEETETG